MAPNDHLQSNNIPSDIVFDILLKLRIKSLYRFKSASKDWLALINNVLKVRIRRKLIVPSISKKNPRSFYTLDSQFSNEFVEINGFSDHSLKIVGSCNGLILLRCLSREACCNILYLWNPLTGKHRLIPSPDVEDVKKKDLLIEGLSYDSAKNEFKIVMAIDDYESKFMLAYKKRTYVFSTSNSVSSSSSWKRVGHFLYYKIMDQQAVVLNGFPHWIVAKTLLVPSRVIVYFDPRNEAFVELQVPDMGSSSYTYNLTVLGKSLCCVTSKVFTRYDTQIWVLKESSWSRLFVMLDWALEGIFSHVFMPLCTTIDGEEDELSYSGDEARTLAFYNLKQKISEWRLKLDPYCYINHMVCYVESLASP